MINPQGMTVLSWFDAVVLSLGDQWAFGTLLDPDSWQDFAAGIVRASTLTQRALPDPYTFNDWRAWAERAYPMLEGQG